MSFGVVQYCHSSKPSHCDTQVFRSTVDPFQWRFSTSRWMRWRWSRSGLCWPSGSRIRRPPSCTSGGEAR